MKEIKKYQAGELMLLKEKLSPINKKAIEEFLTLCRITAGASKIRNIERVLIKCLDILEIPLNKLTPSILIELLTRINKSDLEKPTKNEMKKHFKRFILNCPIFKGKDDLKDVLKKFKVENDVNHKKINPDTIVKENEINPLMRVIDSVKYKTILILSWETSARPKEVLEAKWEQINFNNKTIRLFSNKTAGSSKGGWRILPINESVAHLERLKEEWDFPDRTDKDFIFVGFKRENPLTLHTWEQILKKASIKAINRRINPYLIRHGRLTQLQDKLPPKAYEDYAGHSLEMASRYRHPSQAQLLETMKQGLYSIKELTKEQKNDYEKKIQELQNQIKELKGNTEKRLVTIEETLNIMNQLSNLGAKPKK